MRPGMIESPRRIRWFGETSPSSIDDELLDLMQRSGCLGVFFGVESGSPLIQEKIRKFVDPKRFREIAPSKVSGVAE